MSELVKVRDSLSKDLEERYTELGRLLDAKSAEQREVEETRASKFASTLESIKADLLNSRSWATRMFSRQGSGQASDGQAYDGGVSRPTSAGRSPEDGRSPSPGSHAALRHTSNMRSLLAGSHQHGVSPADVNLMIGELYARVAEVEARSGEAEELRRQVQLADMRAEETEGDLRERLRQLDARLRDLTMKTQLMLGRSRSRDTMSGKCLVCARDVGRSRSPPGARPSRRGSAERAEEEDTEDPPPRARPMSARGIPPEALAHELQVVADQLPAGSPLSAARVMMWQRRPVGKAPRSRPPTKSAVVGSAPVSVKLVDDGSR